MIRRVVEPRPNGPLPELELHGAEFSVERAFAYCERMARGHYENFPVASRFVPAALRPYIWSIYAFARSADDFADEPRYAGRRDEALASWEDQLERACHGEAEHPVFIALRETIERCGVPVTPLRDLLTAFQMDLSVSRYPTYQALEGYMAHSAQPVGRLILYVFGYRDAALHAYSDDLCRALNLTNFCQDVAIDLGKGRLYLPEEDLAHFGLDEKTLARGEVTPQFRDLMRFSVARARSLYERGRPLIDKVGPELGFELAMIWHGGTTILDKIEAVDYDVFRRRPQLTGADKARMAAKAAAQRWPRFIGARR